MWCQPPAYERYSEGRPRARSYIAVFQQGAVIGHAGRVRIGRRVRVGRAFRRGRHSPCSVRCIVVGTVRKVCCMGHLWALIQEYLDRQGGMSQAALARKMGTSPQTLGSWKKRGSRPEPEALRALAVAIEQPYEVV